MLIDRQVWRSSEEEPLDPVTTHDFTLPFVPIVKRNSVLPSMPRFLASAGYSFEFTQVPGLVAGSANLELPTVCEAIATAVMNVNITINFSRETYRQISRFWEFVDQIPDLLNCAFSKQVMSAFAPKVDTSAPSAIFQKRTLDIVENKSEYRSSVRPYS